MKIVLVTENSNYKQFEDATISVVDKQTGISLIKKHNQTYNLRALDTEGNGLDPIKHEVLLLGIGFEDQTYFIIDTCSIPDTSLFVDDKGTYIAHKAQYDYGMLKHTCNTTIYNWWCTMITEQRLYAGCGFREGYIGRSFSLAATIANHTNTKADEVDKDVRNDFIGIPRSQYRIAMRHLMYLVQDLRHLIPIYHKQYALADKRNALFYLEHIGNQQPWAVSDMEIAGLYINKPKWLALEEKHKEQQFIAACKLDEEFRRLRDTLPLTEDERQYLRTKKYDSIRQRFIYTAPDLFGNSSALEIGDESNINWGSHDEVMIIFGRLKLPLPTTDKQIDYAVPKFILKKYKKHSKWEIDKRHYSFTTKKDELQNLLIDHPDHKGKKFIELLLEHRKYTKLIDSYGSKFLEKTVNKKTGKVHTVYRTDTAITGRWQSGDTKKQPDKFALQTMPRMKELRQCFTGKSDEVICTADLGGAEVVIMCDFSNDRQLYEWAVINDDAHSPIAQSTWRTIYHYRAGKMCGIWNTPDEFFYLKDTQHADNILALNRRYEHIEEALIKARSLVINKQENTDMRTSFKPMTFGTVYQMHDKKAGKTLGIPTDEGAVGIQAIRRAIPDTFKYVDGNIAKAIEQGYLVLNTRTGNRIWFPELIKAYKAKAEPTWWQLNDVKGIAANSPFQGTQSDMLKEAIIELSMYIRLHQLNASIPGMVHDETVTRMHHSYASKKMFIWYSDKAKMKLQPHKPLLYPITTKPDKSTLHRLLDEQTIQIVNFPEFIKNIMIEAANRYLTHFKMGCDYEVLTTWTK